MAKLNLGRVGLVPKGTYDNTKTYAKMDVVFYPATGSSYVSLADDNSAAPSDATRWQSLADVSNEVAAANAATARANTAAEAAEGVSGEVADLKSHLNKYCDPFEETITDYTNGIVAIQILDSASANYESYRIRAIQKNSTYHWYMKLQGYDGENWVDIDNVLSAFDAEATYPRVETLVSNYNKYTVTIDWNYVRDSDIANTSITGIILKNSIVYKPFADTITDIKTLKTNEQMYNSIFAVAVPSAIDGIVDFNVSNPLYSNYEKYRFSIVRHNTSYHIHIQVQGYDGTSWNNVDSFLITAADAPSPVPAVEVISSTYGRMSITVVWGRMGTVSLTGQNFVLKDRVVNKTQIAMQTQIDAVSAKAQLPSYELADNIKHVVTVKKDGTGDYTTIGAAYEAITDSAFDNQYEVVVYPGTYNENNLMPPAYTHTHGIYPMQTIVDSTGTTGSDIDNSVFDQGYAPSKLSNLWIKSATKYCVHQDVELRGVTLINENLYCEKLAGGSQVSNACIGIGADFDGAKFIWRNCTFVNGAVTSHTNPNDLPNANQHIVYENCTFVDAYVSLMVAGNTYGEYVCEVKGCRANEGNTGLSIKFGSPITGIAVNQPWQVIGSDNNFAPVFVNTSDTSVTDDWDAINTTDKRRVVATASITKGKFVSKNGGVCNASTPLYMVAGLAVASGVSGDYVPVWASAFAYTGANGEYGIDANGELSASATVKVGYVFNNIFYPYY